MSGGIYLVQDDSGLVKMNEQAYDSEDLLQGLLTKYPDLLAGDQINSTEPRRWLLVAREVSLASEEDGAGRWSVDHLFLDQDAIPTIVEVKRSTDTRIRREVVGQMLEYAANAVVYWPVVDLRDLFEEREKSEQELDELLESEADPEGFWQKVKTNLQAGRVRFIFVSDEIPTELRRIVEFLNQQMDPAEVLAVEIKQYVSQDLNVKTLVPRIIGQTGKPPTPRPGKWDKKSFFRELETQAPEAIRPAEEIFEWAESKASRIVWGRGKQYGTFSPTLDHKGIEHKFISAWTDGSLPIWFGDMRTKPPFSDELKRSEFLRRLNEIPGITIPDKAIDKYPSISLSTLNNEAALKQFLGVLDWFVQEVEAS